MAWGRLLLVEGNKETAPPCCLGPGGPDLASIIFMPHCMQSPVANRNVGVAAGLRWARCV